MGDPIQSTMDDRSVPEGSHCDRHAASARTDSVVQASVTVSAKSRNDFLPASPPAHPGIREDLGRCQSGALVNRRPTRVAAHSCLDFPALAVGADEDVTAPPVLAATVPPVTFDPHRLTLQH